VVTLCTKSLDIQENLCYAHTVNRIYVNGMNLKRNRYSFPIQHRLFSITEIAFAVQYDLNLEMQFKLNSIFQLGRALDQAVSRRPLTADARVRSPVSPCERCGGQCSIGTDFSQGTSVFPPSILFRQCSIRVVPKCAPWIPRDPRPVPSESADTLLQWLLWKLQFF